MELVLLEDATRPRETFFTKAARSATTIGESWKQVWSVENLVTMSFTSHLQAVLASSPNLRLDLCSNATEQRKNFVTALRCHL